MASDSLNEREATVVIFVRDVNDMPPEFEKNLYVTSMIEEAVMTDAPLLQVKLGPVLCQGYLLITSQFDLWCDFIYLKKIACHGMFSQKTFI